MNLIPKPRRRRENAPGKELIQSSCRLSTKCANRRTEGFVRRLAIGIGDQQNHRETMCGVIRLDLAHDLNAQRMWRLAPDGQQRLPNVPVEVGLVAGSNFAFEKAPGA